MPVGGQGPARQAPPERPPARPGGPPQSADGPSGPLPRRVRIGNPPQPPPPATETPLPPRPRRHRYREDDDGAFTWLPQGGPRSAPPDDTTPFAAQGDSAPDQTIGRRARRRAEEAAARQTPPPPAPPATAAQPPAPPAQPLAPAAPPPAPAAQPPAAAAQALLEPVPVTAQPAPTKPGKLVSKRGWRRWAYTLTRINFGLTRDEKYELELRTRVARKPRGSYQIGVLGLKGGAGKTTTTVTLGTTLAQVRGDRILVLDADPGAGNLGERAGRTSPASISDLLADKDLSHYNDIRAHTSVNAANLEILPAAEYTAAKRGLSGQDLRFAVDTVSKFYNLVLADCGAGLFDPVTRGVLETASAIVIVTNVSIDSAKQAEIALDWLRNNGYQDLLSRACVVVNHVALGETNVAARQLVRQFEQLVQPGRVVLLPWDKHIAAGAEIQLDQLGPVYRRRVLELAAALSDDFERAGRR